jgi:HD-GYP domain-containing protein (c-di-GMP phosphodiesterase class II)
MTLDQSIREIQANRGTQFDPKVVDAFVRVIQRKDLQSLVEQAMRRSDDKHSLQTVSVLKKG